MNIPPSTLPILITNKSDILDKYESNKMTMKRMKISGNPVISREVSLLNRFI